MATKNKKIKKAKVELTRGQLNAIVFILHMGWQVYEQLSKVEDSPMRSKHLEKDFKGVINMLHDEIHDTFGGHKDHREVAPGFITVREYKNGKNDK